MPARCRALCRKASACTHGNPLDLGFTIVEGTYNGLVDRSYNDPSTSPRHQRRHERRPHRHADSRIAGINVAKQLGGELVSFLVPARLPLP